MKNMDSKKNKYTNICDAYIKSLEDCERKNKILSSDKYNDFHCQLVRQLFSDCIEFDKKTSK